MGRPIVHVEIMGRDARKLQAFYADLFDWRISAPSGPEFGFYGMLDPASSGLGGGIGQEPGGHGRVTVYVEVPDAQAALDRAVSLGGTVALPPTQIPGGPKIAQFVDPDGNITGLMEA